MDITCSANCVYIEGKERPFIYISAYFLTIGLCFYRIQTQKYEIN